MYKPTIKEKSLLKRYKINIKELLDESECMINKRTLAAYIQTVEECAYEAEHRWPLKQSSVITELGRIINIMEKVEKSLNKEK